MSKRIEAEQSSGNVFADLGMADSEDLFAKTELEIKNIKTAKAILELEEGSGKTFDSKETLFEDLGI
ncbi:MAG: hypothetical protein HQL67_12355 [Magnetococcales bacterium]|nr:hypothetical protein [Magnetococcales bacterium]